MTSDQILDTALAHSLPFYRLALSYFVESVKLIMDVRRELVRNRSLAVTKLSGTMDF